MMALKIAFFVWAIPTALLLGVGFCYGSASWRILIWPYYAMLAIMDKDGDV